MKTSDKILTFSAIFISVLALVVSIFQTRIMQKQSKAAVWPSLSNGQSYGPAHYIYTVNNDGVGPALIKKVTFNYKGTKFKRTNKLIDYLAELETKETKQSMRLNYEYANIHEGRVLRPEQEVKVFNAQDSIGVYLGFKYLNETEIFIEYCSIYDECWLMHNDTIKAL